MSDDFTVDDVVNAGRHTLTLREKAADAYKIVRNEKEIAIQEEREELSGFLLDFLINNLEMAYEQVSDLHFEGVPYTASGERQLSRVMIEGITIRARWDGGAKNRVIYEMSHRSLASWTIITDLASLGKALSA